MCILEGLSSMLPLYAVNSVLAVTALLAVTCLSTYAIVSLVEEIYEVYKDYTAIKEDNFPNEYVKQEAITRFNERLIIDCGSAVANTITCGIMRKATTSKTTIEREIVSEEAVSNATDQMLEMNLQMFAEEANVRTIAKKYACENLSERTIKHSLNKHVISEVYKQNDGISRLSNYIDDNTSFFNIDWTLDEVGEACQYCANNIPKNYKMGDVNNIYYHGEELSVFISDEGYIQSIYGNHNEYTIDMIKAKFGGN